MASRSSTAERLMMRLLKRKNPNCLTACTNWPTETPELRWSTKLVACPPPTAFCFFPFVRIQPWCWPQWVSRIHRCYFIIIQLQSPNSALAFGLLCFTLVLSISLDGPDVTFTGTIFGRGQGVHGWADHRDAAHQAEGDIRKCPEEASGGLCHLCEWRRT